MAPSKRTVAEVRANMARKKAAIAAMPKATGVFAPSVMDGAAAWGCEDGKVLAYPLYVPAPVPTTNVWAQRAAGSSPAPPAVAPRYSLLKKAVSVAPAPTPRTFNVLKKSYAPYRVPAQVKPGMSTGLKRAVKTVLKLAKESAAPSLMSIRAAANVAAGVPAAKVVVPAAPVPATRSKVVDLSYKSTTEVIDMAEGLTYEPTIKRKRSAGSLVEEPWVARLKALRSSMSVKLAMPVDQPIGFVDHPEPSITRFEEGDELSDSKDGKFTVKYCSTPYEATENDFPSFTHEGVNIWDTAMNWADTINKLDKPFTIRPKVEDIKVEPPKSEIKKTTFNSLVKDSFKATSEYGGTLEVLYSDFRHAVRDPNTCIAIASSRDWKSERRGAMPPAKYLYAECRYPKPTYDDSINSRLCFQRVFGKPIFTMLVKEQARTFPKLVDLRSSLRQLADGLAVIGSTEVTIPALCMDRDRLKYEDVIYSIVELLCDRGINVRLCTVSRGQYYGIKAILRLASKKAGIVATDSSTPADWQPVEGNMHYHKCFACSTTFSHWHKFFNIDHPQFEKQCPNRECTQYHRGKNPTNSQVVADAPLDNSSAALAYDRLHDPQWIKEASVFPAAIETAVESATSNMSDLLESLFPSSIPDVTREERTIIRKTGYAGAVDAKPKTPMITVVSGAVGLAEPRERKLRDVKTPERPSFRKNFSTNERKPIKPGTFKAMDVDKSTKLLQISGCTGVYEQTCYRVGGSRSSHKKQARRATEWLRYGWHNDFFNRFTCLKDELCNEDLPCNQEVHILKDSPSDQFDRRSVKKAKRELSDDYWMEYFKQMSCDQAPTIEYVTIKRRAKKIGVKVCHMSRQALSGASAIDLTGALSNLSETTNDLVVVDKRNNIIKSEILNDPSKMMLCVTTYNSVHKYGWARTFSTNEDYASSSPILNTTHGICSFITMSDYNGNYALLDKHTLEKERICEGAKCSLCRAEKLLRLHSPKGKNNRKSKNTTTINNKQWASPSAVAKHTADLVELKLRTERQSEEISEITKRINTLKVDTKRNQNVVNKITRSAGDIIAAPTLNKNVKRKKTPKSKSSYSVIGAIKSATGMATVLVACFLMLCSLTLPVSSRCFDGFYGEDIIAGRVSCIDHYYIHDNLSHFLHPALGGSDNPLNIRPKEFDSNWYNFSNNVIADFVPCNIVLRKDVHEIIVDDVLITDSGDSADTSYWTWAVTLSVIMLAAWTYLIYLVYRNRKLAGERHSIAFNGTEVLLLLMLLPLCFSTPVKAGVTTVAPKTAEQKVVEAKETLDQMREWFLHPGQISLNSLIQKGKELDVVALSLSAITDAKDFKTTIEKVNHLKASLGFRTSELENTIKSIKDLTTANEALRKRIDELEQSNHKATAAFEEYKSRIPRSTDENYYTLLVDTNLDVLTSMESDLKSEQRELRSFITGAEEKGLFFTSPLTRDNNLGDIPPPGTNYGYSGVVPGRLIKSATNKKVLLSDKDKATMASNKASATSASGSQTNNNESVKAIVIFYANKDSAFNTVADNAFKVRFGVNSDVNCDSPSASYTIYEGYKVCNTHAPVGSIIGTSYKTCSIGNSGNVINRYVATKPGGELLACSVSCYDVNTILLAMRHNQPSILCMIPFVSGGHWDISDDLDQMDYYVLNARSFVVLSNTIVMVTVDYGNREYKSLYSESITVCCRGYLASELSESHTFYDGLCLCKSNLHTIERRVFVSLRDYYMRFANSVPMTYSTKTITSVAIIIATGFIHPVLAVLVGLTMFAYNAYADCSVKNFHTIYVGDSSTKQIYTTMYMQVGDCFTLGENTFELISIDNVFKYKRVATYPTAFTSICSDIDWGCGMAEGSKICSEYKKDCENKCTSTPGCIYKKHCLHTTTFHGDGCYGFMVQDHSVSVHGGVCLKTNTSSPYYGYSRVYGLSTRKFTFKVSSFDQSRVVTINADDLIYEDVDFTIQDILIKKDRIPAHILEAGNLMCSYVDVTGNDFCHSVVDDTTKLTNPSCVNLDWTFLGDEAKWQIDDLSSIITPYVYDLFETCDINNVVKGKDTLDVTPNGVVLSFKIDSQYHTSAFTVDRCSSVVVGGWDSVPGYVNQVQTSTISATVKSNAVCFITLRVDPCSLVSLSYCKLDGSENQCSWVVYCSIVIDAKATIVGTNDLVSFNFTSGKFSMPTVEYSRTIFSSVYDGSTSALSSVASYATSATNWVPGISYIKSILTFPAQKCMITIIIAVVLWLSVCSGNATGIMMVAIFAWVYFFTGLVHASIANEPDHADVQLWHLLLIIVFAAVDWVKFACVVYTYICRRASGIWHAYNLSNYVVGIPLIDWLMYIVCLFVFPQYWAVTVTTVAFHGLVEALYRMYRYPQSRLFNVEVLFHSPLANYACRYVSRSGEYVASDRSRSVTSLVLDHVRSTITVLPSTSFVGDIGYDLFNSPTDDSDSDFDGVPEVSALSGGEDDWYDTTNGGEIVYHTATVVEPPQDRYASMANGHFNRLGNFVFSAKDPTIDQETLDDTEEYLRREGYFDGEENDKVERDPKEAERVTLFEQREQNTVYAQSVTPLVLPYCEPSTSGTATPVLDDPELRDLVNKDQAKLSKRTKQVLKNLGVSKVLFIIHPILIKHIPTLIKELVRLGRRVDRDDGSNDVFIMNEPTVGSTDKNSYSVTVKYHKDYDTLVYKNRRTFEENMRNFETCVPESNRIILPNTKCENFVTAVCRSINPDYKYSEIGTSPKRHYIEVPIGGGFEEINDYDMPFFAKVPVELVTADDKSAWAREIDFSKILILTKRRTNVPKNWTLIATVFMFNESWVRGKLFDYKYPTATHNKIIENLKHINSEKSSIRVKDVPSIYAALNIIGSSARKRQHDILILEKPLLSKIATQISRVDPSEAACVYYSFKMVDGDFIKLTVGSHIVSVYKTTLKAAAGEVKRSFMVFKHRSNKVSSNPKVDFGHTAIYHHLFKGITFTEKQWCKRLIFGDCASDLFVATTRENINDLYDVDYIKRGIVDARMQCSDLGIEHLYVALPPTKFGKAYQKIISNLVNEFTTHGIELTILTGLGCDIKMICIYVNNGLKMISNNADIKIETNLDLPKEADRKDTVSKHIKNCAMEAVDGDSLELGCSMKVVRTTTSQRDILMFKKGRVDHPDWEYIKDEDWWRNYIWTLHEDNREKIGGRRQCWIYSVDEERMLGLLPGQALRPAHYGIHFADTRFYGKDIVGLETEGWYYLPVSGKLDTGGRCSYLTEPILCHGGGLVSALYTTEVRPFIGKPYVFAEKRLMSGAEVFVATSDYEDKVKSSHYASQGFITSCSRVTFLNVRGYLHPLKDFDELRVKDPIPDYLHEVNRVSVAAGNVKEILNRMINPHRLSLNDMGKIPTVNPEDYAHDNIVKERVLNPFDPITVSDNCNVVDKDTTNDEDEWYKQYANFCFTKSEVDCSYVKSVIVTSDYLNEEGRHHGHVVCPEHNYSASEGPLREFFESDRIHFRKEFLQKDKKRFCSLLCATMNNAAFYKKKEALSIPAASYCFSPEANVNTIDALYDFEFRKQHHPMLPELDRLNSAISASNFNRTKWYEVLLSSIEDDDVFIAYQLKNRKRFERLNREFDSVCSSHFDFPDTMLGGVWAAPPIVYRTILTADSMRTASIAVFCTDSGEDRHDNKPIIVNYRHVDGIADDRAYVLVRRAALLLLSQGWNYFDVHLCGSGKHWSPAKLAASLTFNVNLFGAHSINVVSTNQDLNLAINMAVQIIHPLNNLCPPQLKVGSPFLWDRGVKTSAISESMLAWTSLPKASWHCVDVSRRGLSSEDCPEIIVSAENRPEFMGDNMAAIWSITNGIKSGTCYSSGFAVVGSNHCTLANTICVETEIPQGSGIVAKRAQYVSKLAKSYSNGDVDMHNSITAFTKPKKGEIYGVINPSQRRGRWLMCTACDEYEPSTQTNFHKFVPVEVDWIRRIVKLAPYKLMKGLSGAPIINSRGQSVGIYGLSTNITYSDKSISAGPTNTTLCHSMVTDSNTESDNYFIEAAKELLSLDPSTDRFSFLEAPTGTGKSTLFPLAVLKQLVHNSGTRSASVCMLEPTRAAVHNCYDRVVDLLSKTSDRWKKIYSVRLSTGKRGQTEGEHFRSEGTGKIQLSILTYGRFIADYRADSEVPHNYSLILMDEIHTRSKDTDVATAYLISSDYRVSHVKVCYMTATSVGRVCERRLCEGRDLEGTRFKILDEYLVETRKIDGKEPGVVGDSSYFTIDLRQARLNLKTKAQYVSWPKSAYAGGRCLVFLPSRNDCEKFVSWSKNNYPAQRNDFVSLHAGSSIKDLNTLPPNAVIGCTDFASTAITVPNCKCVVDFMEDWSPVVTLFSNETGFTYRNTISKEVVSKQVSIQRKGRTGRTCDGTYYSCASITPIEETRLTESMHAQIYFNLLLKMGQPALLRSYIANNPDAEKIYEHSWLEPDNMNANWTDKHQAVPDVDTRVMISKFLVRCRRKLEIIREWDKDQLWWYLCAVVGQDYLDFCFSAENASTHGFGVSNSTVNRQMNECWSVVPTEEEARKLREDFNFSIESYIEDFLSFDNYVQRAHDVVGAIDLHTLAKRVRRTAPKMYNRIDRSVVNINPDTVENMEVEGTTDPGDVVINKESFCGFSLGALAACSAIGVICSSGLFAYNHNADWQATDIYSAEKVEFAGALYYSMEEYWQDKVLGREKLNPNVDQVISLFDLVINWIQLKWDTMSEFFKAMLTKLVSKTDGGPPPAGMTLESASGVDLLLEQVVKHLISIKAILIGLWYKFGALNVSSMVTSLGIGMLYDRMCDTFGIMMANVITAAVYAASSILLGGTQTAINSVIMAVSYIVCSLWTYTPNPYGGSRAARTGALMLTSGGAAAISILIRGSFLSKPATMVSGLNISNGLISMINPYNTGVSKVSDGIIIAKMISNMCNKEKWKTTDGFAAASTLMSMLFRCDAATVMVSATAGLFLGFAKVYISNTEFWFKMASAMNVKHNDAYKDVVASQIDKFDSIMDSILGVAGVLANPMSLISIVTNIMADITVAYMRDQSADIPVGDICKETALYYSGVSMIYGVSAAIFKVCSQLRASVTTHFSEECDLSSLTSIWNTVVGLVNSFTFTSFIEEVKRQVLLLIPSFSFECATASLLDKFLTYIWEPVRRFINSCYQWCKDKITVLFNRAESRIKSTISGAVRLDIGSLLGGKSDDDGVVISTDSHVFDFLDVSYVKIAYLLQNTLKCPLTKDEIVEALKARNKEIFYCDKDALNRNWLTVCGLLGWVYQKFRPDMPKLVRNMRNVIGTFDDDIDGTCYSDAFGSELFTYLISYEKVKYSSLIQDDSEGRFPLVGVSSEEEGMESMFDEDRSSIETVTTQSDYTDRRATFVRSDSEILDISLSHLFMTYSSANVSLHWARDMDRMPYEDEAIETYLSADPRFWIKYKLQDTSDSRITPLIVQSVTPNVSNFGEIPNIICDLDSKLFVTPDKNTGCGDYLYGVMHRPWDIVCLDNIALCKLLSICCDVQDCGTHVTVAMNMSTGLTIHINISVSYTNAVACIGLLCQIQNNDTKEVTSDLASVEIMLWSEADGIKMIGTCPPSTAGSWDLLYNSVLKNLPFFDSLEWRHINMDESRRHFDRWVIRAADDLADESLIRFEAWKTKFVQRRYSKMNAYRTLVSSARRTVSKLCSKLQSSFEEAKHINAYLNDPERHMDIADKVKYASYYKDMSAALHGRLGPRDLSIKYLPDGVEDFRIEMSDTAMAAWCKKIIVATEECTYNATSFHLSVDKIDFHRYLHHPASFDMHKSYSESISTVNKNHAICRLIKMAYFNGHNVLIGDKRDSIVRWQLCAAPGVCYCSVFYLFDGVVLQSAMAARCRSGRCSNPTSSWVLHAYPRVTDPNALKTDNGSSWTHESDNWIAGLFVDSAESAYNTARGLALKVYEGGVDVFADVRDPNKTGADIDAKIIEKVFGKKRSDSMPTKINTSDGSYLDYSEVRGETTNSSSRFVGRSGFPCLRPDEKVKRIRASRANASKPRLKEQERASDFYLTPGVQKLFTYKKDLGDMFFEYIRDIAIAEKCNRIKKPDFNAVTAEKIHDLKEKYSILTLDELMDLRAMGTDETNDVDLYMQVSKRKPICDEAPWCDGWDNVAISARKQDFWLTDGNQGLYHPHDVDDDAVIRDISKVNKLVDHLPKDVWADCKYKGRMLLPERETDIGNVYASRAACKAQLLYEYLPGFFNNHKVFFEPCCGFGGFAQYFSHQMRSMEPRKYLVSTMSQRGHAQPNWSLMQARESNCRVIRVLENVRDGNICDPKVLDGCCQVIKDEGVTMLMFDIGERFQDPRMDDAWYLAPRNVRGGFDATEEGWKYGVSVCSAMRRMVQSLPSDADAIFKVNTFSPRTTDIIHQMSSFFRKVRALKLATTPEANREFYLYCGNKRDNWEAPLSRSILMKNSIRELTWSALYRAENMYRTKGRHAKRPMSHKWFTPDTSGTYYRMIPNAPEGAKELDVTRLPQGHAINISTGTPRGDVNINIEFNPDWDRRFRCMKDYVQKVNKVAKSRTNRGRDSIKFDNTVRTDFSFVKGIGSFAVKQKSTVEKHSANDLISSYLSSTAGMNLRNATYGQTQGTPEYVKPALKKRLDVQPGQPDPTCVLDFAKAVHCLMSEKAFSRLGQFRFMTKEEAAVMINKQGSTGILDPGSNLKEFMEIYPEWYELAWEHVLRPHTRNAPTPTYQSVRIKPEPKGRKDAEDGRLLHKKGVSLDELSAGTNLSPRFIQFSDAVSRIAHIIVFGNILEYHGKHKLYKGSINGTPPHIQGRVMRSYWDLHNPIKKRIIHVGNNKDLDIGVEPLPGYIYATDSTKFKPLDYEGRLGSSQFDCDKSAIEYEEDLPAGLTIDFSALDSTVTVSERMIMTDLWTRFFSTEDEKNIVRGICKDMTYAMCLDDSGNIWVRDGQRGSGEILTSIENTWLVTGNIVCAMSHALGVSIEDLTRTQGYINVLTQPGGCNSVKVNVSKEIANGAKHKRFEFGEVPLLVDGDDVVIISTRKRIDTMHDYMNGNYQWLACNRKVIRSGNKGGATRYTRFEDLSFCSHRYEAVYIGQNASQYNPKFMPRAEKGRLCTRGDVLSVAEDNNFKIYFLPIRPVADIMAKLMLTLKVKAFRWDATKTAIGECVDLTQSKIISYLLLYPQCRWVRYTCLTLLCVTGDNLATFQELRKRYRDFNELNLRHTSKLLSSMNSLYGVSSLDDVSLREYRNDFAEIRKQYYNSRLTGHVCQTTRAKWLEVSFDWLARQQAVDTYPLMWDSSIFKHYKIHAAHTGDSGVQTLKERLQKLVQCSQPNLNNTEGLWQRILNFTG